MADIRVNEVNWISLRDSALFFVPKLLTVCVREGVGQSDLVNASRSVGTLYAMGPPAVKSILKCQPTTFHKAQSAVRAFNHIARERKLSSAVEEKDIIACVLKLLGYTEMVTLLNITDSEVAHQAKFSSSLVMNVRRNGRVHLEAAATIVDTIGTLLQRSPSRTGNMSSKELAVLVDYYVARSYSKLISTVPVGIKAIHKREEEGFNTDSAILFDDLVKPVRHTALYQDIW